MHLLLRTALCAGQGCAQSNGGKRHGQPRQQPRFNLRDGTLHAPGNQRGFTPRFVMLRGLSGKGKFWGCEIRLLLS